MVMSEDRHSCKYETSSQCSYLSPINSCTCLQTLESQKRRSHSSFCERMTNSECSIGSRSNSQFTLIPEDLPQLNRTIEVYAKPVEEDDYGSINAIGGSSSWNEWETHHVTVSRVPGYGFGIAVSGGRDNPHFANGDPSIAVSDVLKAGPAQDLLQVNDRIISVNGVSLENVEYATAVQVLRDSGNTVSLTVRRRATSSGMASSPTTLKVTLSKGKKEDYGIVLGCKLFIKDISSKTKDQLNSTGQSLNEGDIITKINNTNCSDIMSLKEAKKLIESCKEKLNLVVLRESRIFNNQSTFQDQAYNNGYGVDVPNSYSGQNLYVAPPSRSTLIGDNNVNNNSGISSNHTPSNSTSAPNGSRIRGPLSSLSQENSSSPQHNHPPRPPPPRPEDYYSSRRQLYDEDPLSQRNKPASEPRLISFQKDGSVGLRLAGGNLVGIFVSAVQPGSPASLQGLCPGDNILKINEMDMKGVTREEAVLFLLSLQDQIDLIVQHSPEEYQAISAQNKGDSFHIKCHFHYMEATKGEMTFRSGDVFHVVDTLHNGTVGAWQVFRIGRNNQEVQKGTIPNKARAEELATAQFNANKKELTQGASESRGNFFRRRRSTHRRSKSLGKEHWDDVVFSDSISKFPAYERVILKHPGFVRPVILFGPIADLARERLLRDYPDKFIAPQLDISMDDNKSKNTSGIIRLSGIRAIMERGKHALLDITPNAVDRLNYAQFYPIVIFLKADNKHTIKQLRQGIPKSAHKSSKKLLEYCLRMERVWNHIFTQTINLNDATMNTWFNKLTELIQRCQSQQLWISETKRSEPLSDDFLFPMCSTNESRLSYASSPESDAEVGGNETRSGPRLLRASSDPSVATTQDNLDRDNLTLNEMVPPPPPYTSGFSDNKYGFPTGGMNDTSTQGLNGHETINNASNDPETGIFNQPLPHSPPQSPHGIYGHVPDLPPRIDRGVKPPGGVLLPGPTPGRNPPTLRHNPQLNSRPSAQERLFGTPRNTENDALHNSTNNVNERQSNGQSSLDRHRHLNNTNSYDSMSSYDSYAPNGLSAVALANARLGPNAPDDLKVGPRNENQKYDAPPPINTLQKRLSGGGGSMDVGPNMNVYNSRDANINSVNSPNSYTSRDNGSGLGIYNSRDMNNSQRTLPSQPRSQIPTADFNKYGRNNTSGDFMGSIGKAAGAGGPSSVYKPVPPPKPKHYRPPMNDNQPIQPHHAKSFSVGNGGADGMNSRTNYMQQTNQNLIGNSPGSIPTNGYNYSGASRNGPWTNNVMHAHSHSHSGPGSGSSYHLSPHSHQQSAYSGNPNQAPPYNGPPPHIRSPPQNTNSHVIDLAGSREQRGSAFELYRKPQHLHNMSSTDCERENFEPENPVKINKKASRKSSFLKSITLDLFRSKSSKKVSKHHSLCEYDMRDKSENWSNCKMNVSDQQNSLKKVTKLLRSNSSCERAPLKPILKRQSSFCENRIDQNIKEIPMNTPVPCNVRRRQNSLCEIETEPKIRPLRRQNSLIEYGYRRNDENRYFNMITAIDPIYQRQIELRRMRIKSSLQDINTSNCIYNSTVNTSIQSSNMNSIISDVNRLSMQCPYSQHEQNSVKLGETSMTLSNSLPINSLDTSKHEIGHYDSFSRRSGRHQMFIESSNNGEESPYSTRNFSNKQKLSVQNPYVTKEEILKSRIESPYATKEEMLRQRQKREDLYSKPIPDNNDFALYSPIGETKKYSESPYKTKQELLIQRIYCNNSIYEEPRERRTLTSPSNISQVHPEPIYSSGRIVNCDNSASHISRCDIRDNLINSQNMCTSDKSGCICEDISTSVHEPCTKLANPVDSLYVSRQEILSQKAALLSKERGLNLSKEDNKLETIKSRNLAKKEKIYQSKREAINSMFPPLEPIYVSKRVLKDPVIYESNEVQQTEQTPTQEVSKESPYELSDKAHLSRRESLYQSRREVLPSCSESTINFDSLRNPKINQKDKPKEEVTDTKISNSETSIQTRCESECSIQFQNQPQSTPYTSQDLEKSDTVSLFKCNNKSIKPSGAIMSSNIPVLPNFDMDLLAVGQKGRIGGGEGPCTTWGIFDNEGGTLEDRIWGVSLYIPPGAILPGVKQKIYFSVTDPRLSHSVGGPPIDVDKGEALLSPVVMCGPQGLGFARSVTLRLPHCANTLPSLGLTLNATDSEPSPSWDNILLPATTTLDTVAVKVDHF